MPVLGTFVRQFLAHPSRIGAIAPTSRSTSRRMASFLPQEGAILEIGAGTGAITRAIIKRVQDSSRLTSVEIDPKLASIFRRAFPRVTLREEDAERVMVNAHGAYAAIVSGLPFASLPKKKSHALMKNIVESLRPDGVFIAFQYSLFKLPFFRSYFKTVEIHFSPFNLPPAFVLVCRKKSTNS